MLHIYHGRENINKDNFIFDQIKGKTLLLVPDQFTLQAERDAFFYLQAKGLMDIEVVSISRLGLKVLNEVGGERTTLIDKYGRHMLLTKILTEKNEELGVYRGLERKQSFIEMVNNFISELKQYGATPQELGQIADRLGDNTYLKKKLDDIEKIYQSYEEHIKGKYLDTEDYVSLYADKIEKSKMVRGASIWIYGFDSFTPKNIEVIGQLIRTAPEVNLVLTYGEDSRDSEIFGLTGSIMNRFGRLSEEGGIPWEKTQIPDTYKFTDKVPAIRALEQEIYAIPVNACKEASGVTLLRAANFYSEAESAAAEVLSLVRDQGMAYKDIILICNDLDNRGSIIKRVFSQYGMDLFLDKKRSILHNPASVFLLSLLSISASGYRTEDVFRLLKTGLTAMEWGRIEELELYARKYRIRGTLWKKPFVRGISEYTPQELEAINRSRRQVVELVERFMEEFKKGKTVREKVLILYQYLSETCKLPQRLKAMIQEQEEKEFLDAAGETAQVWNLIMDVLDQFVEIVGDETILAESFGDILKAGLESIEVGLLPPGADGLILGTMQRTRSSHVKAMLVLGANEGILPASAPSDSILSEDEKRFLAEQDIEICKVDEIRLQEEKLAIYKNLSRPTEKLWVSYSASDSEGKEIKPSSIFNKLRTIYPSLEIEQDIADRDDSLELVQAPKAAMEHMAAALRQAINGEAFDPGWKAAMEWYKEKNVLNKLEEGLFFTNKQRELSRNFVEELYKRFDQEEMTVSPSRLEQYSRCPFAHFIGYGLRPDEQRIYEVGGREIGDLYHTCLMEMSRWLTADGVPVNDPESPWMTVSKDACQDKIEEILKGEADRYREGLLASGKEETYRTERLKEICNEMSWILIDHVRRGSIRSIAFEETFGKGRTLEPVKVETDQGAVCIEGKIDRVDVLEDGRVKIIDYKTGQEKFNIQEARKGFRLQLMLYLKAAQEEKREPAGVFYFLISEPSVSADSIRPEELGSKVKEETKKACRMDGIMVDDPSVIGSIVGELSGYSDIAPVKETKNGITGTGQDKLLDEEAFHLLQEEVDAKVEEICGRLLSGDIQIKPKKSGMLSACTYCQYKGICQFDLAFEGCKYEIV